MELQVTLQPMLLKKPECRLVKTDETLEFVLTQWLADMLADAQRNGDVQKNSIMIKVDLVELDEFIGGWYLCDYLTPAESSDDESE